MESLNKGHFLIILLRKNADHQIMQRILKIADQIIVPAPNHTFPPSSKAIIEVKNSGADVPMAIKVAHAMLSLSFRLFDMISKLFTKYPSHTIDNR